MPKRQTHEQLFAHVVSYQTVRNGVGLICNVARYLLFFFPQQKRKRVDCDPQSSASDTGRRDHTACYKWSGMCDHSSSCDTCQVWRKSLHGSLLCCNPPAGRHILELILPVMTGAVHGRGLTRHAENLVRRMSSDYTVHADVNGAELFTQCERIWFRIRTFNTCYNRSRHPDMLETQRSMGFSKKEKERKKRKQCFVGSCKHSDSFLYNE